MTIENPVLAEIAGEIKEKPERVIASLSFSRVNF